MTGTNLSSDPLAAKTPVATSDAELAPSPGLAEASAAAPHRGAIRQALCEIAAGAAYFAHKLSPAQLVALIAASRPGAATKAAPLTTNAENPDDAALSAAAKSPSGGLLLALLTRIRSAAWAPIEFVQGIVEKVSSFLAPTTSEVVFKRRRPASSPLEAVEIPIPTPASTEASRVLAHFFNEELRPPTDQRKEAFAAALEQAVTAARHAKEEAKEEAEARAEDERRRKVTTGKERVLARDMQNGIRNPKAAELANQLEGPFAATEDMVLAQIDDLNRSEH